MIFHKHTLKLCQLLQAQPAPWCPTKLNEMGMLYDALCHYARCQKPCNFGVFGTYRYCNYPTWLFGLQSAQAKFKGSKVLEMVRKFHPISRFQQQQIHFATINGTAWDSKFKPRPEKTVP